MHKIFKIPELLNEIFSYSSTHTNTIAAQVCRLWFSHSTPFIWEMVNLDHILKMLSPFAIGSNDGFQRPLSPKSWDRLSLYSKNVRQLRCLQPRHAAAFILLRPCANLFGSKLTILQWHTLWEYIEYLPPLLTSTLQILHIRLDCITNPDQVDVLFKTIPIRSPSLRAFEINFPTVENNSPIVSQSLGDSLSFLLELVILALPIHCATKELFTILSQLPRLEDLTLFFFFCRLDMKKIYVENLLGQKKEIREEMGKCLPFRSLEKLSIGDPEPGPHPDATFTIAQVFGYGFQFSELVELNFYPCNKPNQIMALMKSLCILCPNIQKITVGATTNLPLPWYAIRPLLKCQALVELKSQSGVDIKLEDILEIATNRSSWTVIHLPSSEPLSYQALLVFARNCPHLKELWLILGLPDLDTMSTTDTGFSSLTMLVTVGSVVTTEWEVAILLSSICRNPLKIRGLGNSWKTIEKMVNFIIMTQLENRTLKDEIALLRARLERN